MMHRRTKIITTLGPATDDEQVMSDMIDAGIDLVRLNFSHGSMEEHKRRVDMVRRISKEKHYNIGILGDLQGAKLRIGRFKEGKVIIQPGDKFTLDAELDLESGTQQVIGFTYKGLVNDVVAGDTLLLDDGRISLKIDSVEGPLVKTTVLVGGELSSNKGMNRKGGGLSAACLTEKDLKDITYAKELDLDYIAISFLKRADDIYRVRELLKENDSDAGIVSKIETSEALEVMEEILAASDAIMVARGDLGVEIGDAEVPGVQKSLIAQAQKTNCCVITATQMMESMVHSPIPTRAEVSDVANAVLDGTDAVMTSGETAVGEYPVEVVKAMSRVCRDSEYREAEKGARRIQEGDLHVKRGGRPHLGEEAGDHAVEGHAAQKVRRLSRRAALAFFPLSSSVSIESARRGQRGGCPARVRAQESEDSRAEPSARRASARPILLGG